LRLVLEGEHPRDIAKYILFREESYATFIEVYIHDWMKIVNGPPSPPSEGPRPYGGRTERRRHVSEIIEQQVDGHLHQVTEHHLRIRNHQSRTDNQVGEGED
jgi:hypothetical protein